MHPHQRPAAESPPRGVMHVSEQVQLTDVLGVLRSMQAVMATGDDIRALETRMDQMTTRMDQMATKEDFRTLETRMDQVDAGIDLLAIKLDRVDSRMDQVDAGIDLLAIKLDLVDSRMDQMDTRMDQMDTRMDQMTTKEDFHALGVLFEEQRDHFKIICEVVTGYAERFDRLENRVTPLEVGRGSVRRGR